MSRLSSQDWEEKTPLVSLTTYILVLFSILAGTLVATLVLPYWLPDLANSILGSQPKVFWFLSRGSALSAYLLLWLSIAFGLALTNRMAQVWPGGPIALDLHEYVSLLGLAFALFHAIILLGDQYINFSMLQVLLPFATQSYRPAWVGLGQISFYVIAVVTFSFYVRKHIGNRSWRLIHYASFASFLMALAHGILSGTDTGTSWMAGVYWATSASFLFLLIYRLLVIRFKQPWRVQAQ
jgi:predicted ferric reductase